MTATDPPAGEQQSKQNRIGLEKSAYRGLPSTLCKGCGHDAITARIVEAFWKMGVEPHRVAKMSGIGCSSKSIAYMLGRSYGFNGVHGRMAAVATGSHLANRSLIHLGITGDGDTASIGLGHFLHMVRRDVPIVYIIENNGVYGLTKGQISATADVGTVHKTGGINKTDPIDCCELAIAMGCRFVARSFSGDAKQMSALIQGALSHRGTAVLDILSPCMTFNNHEGSTRSFSYARMHDDPLHEVGFVPFFEQLDVDYPEGDVRHITLPDGSHLLLKRLDANYDPADLDRAIEWLDRARRERLFLTGLIYRQPGAVGLAEDLGLVDEPLATLPAERLRPPAEALREIMDRFKP